MYGMNNNKITSSSFTTKQPHFMFLLNFAFICPMFWVLSACLRRQRPIPTHNHPNKISSATNHSKLPFNDSQQRHIPQKTFQLPYQQKRCFQERFLPNSPDKKDGSDQTKLFQHRGGSGQEANVKAYRENTHTTSIWLQGPTIWQLETSRFFLTFCSLF